MGRIGGRIGVLRWRPNRLAGPVVIPTCGRKLDGIGVGRFRIRRRRDEQIVAEEERRGNAGVDIDRMPVARGIGIIKEQQAHHGQTCTRCFIGQRVKVRHQAESRTFRL